MTRACARAGVILSLVTLLPACGGGGGDGDGGGSDANSGPRLTISPASITASATPGEIAPTGTVSLSVRNPPSAGLYLEGEFSASGIEGVDFIPSGSGAGTLEIHFRSPGSLLNDTYSDSITLRVCTDQNCTIQIKGSPATVTTAYTVTGTGTTSAILDRSSIQIAVDTREQNSRSETARIQLSNAPASGVHVQPQWTANAIEDVSAYMETGTTSQVDITFLAGQSLAAGTYDDTTTISLCYDFTCVRQVQGSPFTIATSLSASLGVEPGFEPLAVESRIALPHDVIDAQFSGALNQIVMVGSTPVPALYVYDIATGSEHQQLLSKIPSSVSIAPDGLTAAIGHDALISIVDLTTVGQPGAPGPIHLDVSADVWDLVLDGAGNVHAFPRTGQWVNVHSVSIATNTEQISSASVHEGARALLHPSGSVIYTANNGLAPSDIDKWDVSSGVATYLYDSPYHGEYEMCGNLWFHGGGGTIYTACGNTFRSSVVQSEDMIYAGALALSESTSPYREFEVRSLSHSAARNEIALVEYDAGNCSTYLPQLDPCYSHLALYGADFLDGIAVHSIGPVNVEDADYAQHGLFVFHDATGARKYLISRLEAMPNPATEYYLSVIP